MKLLICLFFVPSISGKKNWLDFEHSESETIEEKESNRFIMISWAVVAKLKFATKVCNY